MSTAPLRLPCSIHSINDGIPKELFSEHYMKVHSIIDRIMTHGECISYLPHPRSGPLSVMHKMAGHRGYYMAALYPMSRSASSFFHQSVPTVYPQLIFHIIDYGFLDPLSNCLQLQRLLQEIKQHQDSSSPRHQQVIADLTSLLHHRSLDLTTREIVTLWAGCCVGVLRASESTVNLPHLTLADEQINSTLNRQSVCVLSNCSNTDPFRKGCFIFLSRGSIPLYPVFSLINYLYLHHQCPLFLYKGGTPFLELRYLLLHKLPDCWQVSMEMFLIVALELELQLLLLVLEFQTTSLKPRATGQAKHIKIIIYCMYVLWWTMYGAYLLLCLALLSVVRFAHSYWSSVFHQPLAYLLSGPWPPRLGMGAQGWVARICQPLEQSSSRSWLPIKEAPGYLRHTTFHSTR